jgi:predicted permease
MTSVFQDVRFALRVLRHAPAFTALAVLSIALGIGGNTAIFTLMNAFVLRLLPAPDPVQLVFVERARARGGVDTDFSYEAFQEFHDRNRTFSAIVAFDDTNISVTVDGQPEMAPAEFDGTAFFAMLGARPMIGRVFTTSEDRPGGPPVVVISYAYWNRKFARDRAALGKSVSLKRQPFTIIGVMPPEFLGRRTAGRAPDLWIPIAWQPQLRLKDHDTFEIMARLKAGVTAEQGRQDLDLLYQRYLRTAAGPRAAAQSIHLESAAHGVRRQRLTNELRLLMIAVALLLLIACANVANLLLARSAARQREVAMRVSLGATRWRLIRQLLTESLMIACAGGICGLFLAWWGSNFLLAAMGFDPIESRPDGAILGFTALVSLGTGVLFGLLPAIRSSSSGRNLSLVMRQSTPLREPGRMLQLGNTLMVIQLALSLVLVVGAGLLARSLEKLLHTDVGFERDRVLVAAAIPTFLGYEGKRELRLYETLLERMSAAPGVRSATLSRFRLFVGRWPRHFTVTPQPATAESPEAFCHPIGPRFFETMGIPLLLGREFLRSDKELAPRVAIINEAVARAHMPGVNPLGGTVRFDQGDPYTIVGVVKNVKQISMREDPPRMAIYIPYTQTPPEMLGQINFEIRTSGPPENVIATLRKVVQAVDPDLALIDIGTQAETISERMDEERSLAQLVSMFGGMALLLAMVGLYGTVSYAVARRTSEIGIRMALGAAGRDVVSMLFRETFLLVAAGFVIGVPAALAGSRLIANRLYGIVPVDPVTFAVAGAALATVAVLAALVPAFHASRVDPLVALRWE